MSLMQSHSSNPEEVRIISVRHGQTPRNVGPLEDGIWHIQGIVDDEAASLTSTGLNQANLVGEALATEYPEASVIYTSPLKRCLQTAGKIRDCFLKKYGRELVIIQDERLAEVDHGKYDTMDYFLRNQWCKERYQALLNHSEECKQKIEEFQAKYPNIDLGENPLIFLKWVYNPMQEIPLEEAGREARYIEKLSKKRDPETTMEIYDRMSAAIHEMSAKHVGGETIIVCSHSAALTTFARETELRQNHDFTTIRPAHYEPNLPGSKVVSGNCSLQIFLYNKKTHTLRLDSSRDLNQSAREN